MTLQSKTFFFDLDENSMRTQIAFWLLVSCVKWGKDGILIGQITLKEAVSNHTHSLYRNAIDLGIFTWWMASFTLMSSNCSMWDLLTYLWSKQSLFVTNDKFFLFIFKTSIFFFFFAIISTQSGTAVVNKLVLYVNLKRKLLTFHY